MQTNQNICISCPHCRYHLSTWKCFRLFDFSFGCIYSLQCFKILTNFVNFEIGAIFQWRTKNVAVCINKYQILIIYSTSSTHRNLMHDGFCMTSSNLILTRCSRNQIKHVNYWKIPQMFINRTYELANNLM